jgi:hypothetical protein
VRWRVLRTVKALLGPKRRIPTLLAEGVALAAEGVEVHEDVVVAGEEGEAAMCRARREMRARWLRRRGKRLIRVVRRTITAKRSAGRRWLAEGSLARCTAQDRRCRNE